MMLEEPDQSILLQYRERLWLDFQVPHVMIKGVQLNQYVLVNRTIAGEFNPIDLVLK